MSENAKEAEKLPKGLIGRKGTSSGKSARLPSLKGPRDLTLGGVPKKVFTPTIPARRDKVKENPAPQKSSKPNTSTRGRNERGRGRGRGRGRENTLVQSHSIFEQGPAQKQSRGGSGISYREDGGGSSKVSVKKEKNVSHKDLDLLLRDDFIDDGDIQDDMPPVMLPLSCKLKEEIEIKSDLKVEKEDEEDSKSSNDTEMKCDEKLKTSSSPRKFKNEIMDDLSCKSIFSKFGKAEEGELIFFQLPDTLPGLPPTRKQDSDKPSDTSTTTDSNKTDTETVSDRLSTCSLADFSEGQIGKLQIRKSGKIELLIGNVKLDVTAGTPSGFLQEVVSVNTADGTGSMCVLGHIKHRLICTPNFESLLDS
ncbi:hypothetical protein LOTGIDRAFT_232725 [Lottia gigantea]|uniref:DNA-directed RNA polymerase III subunit RPC4 n=1 Tax=Lottia gigantea TaxID=225164 RepID=V4ADT2_LOTGI|nr:hypothetical protein LOTGIDRAFT_232725 [Lottia gigantea]ESO93285.1 hypothetical protein LOTGIDRAFT_232725 [Lottia gigantea]